MDDANDGHYHEALDRAYCINTMIEELLAEHPAIEDSPGELGVALRRFQDAGQDLYQLIGRVRNSKFKRDGTGEAFNLVDGPAW